jgi:acylphosphatase
MKKRVHVTYEGRVQGVGFRFTCQRIAEDLMLGGWARNMPDGNVEVIAEGEEKRLNTFLSDISKNMARYISRDNVAWESFKGECKGFNIRF